VYFHVEFGVSWTPGQPSKNRQATYISRGFKDQQNQIPKRLQPSNGNSFHSVSPDQRTSQQSAAHSQRIAAVEYPGHYQEYYAPAQYQHVSRRHVTYHARPLEQQLNAQPIRPALPPHTLTSNERRPRSRSRPSHERGHSAPPPGNATPPWDAEPEPMAATVLPSRLAQNVETSKSGPNHTQFRLEDEDQPWSTTFPPGFVLPIDEQGDSPLTQAGDRGTFGAVRRPEERGRVTEIESRAAALMTVDNGFEDQWWNQGPLLVNIGGELKSAAALENMIATRERAPSVDTAEEIRAARARLGSIVSPASDDAEPSLPTRRASLPYDSPAPSIVDIVSPVSDISSPIPSFRMMRRTMTTRSDELHM
jgi:hypothetical protein